MKNKGLSKLLFIPKYWLQTLAWALAFIFILQWLVAYQQIIAVVEIRPEILPGYLVEGYINFFRYYFDDFTPVAISIVAVVQALNIVTISIYMQKRQSRQNNWQGMGPMFISAWGVAAIGAIMNSSARIISDVLLGLAIVLSLVCLWQLSGRLAKVIKTEAK